MESDSVHRRLRKLTAHISPAHNPPPTLLFPTNCSGGLTPIMPRYDNRMHFARQDSRSQAPFMRPASTQQGDKCSSKPSPPLFSQPANTNSVVPKVRRVEGDYKFTAHEPPEFARPSDQPMKFNPKTKVNLGVGEKTSPRMDVVESGGRYVVLIELPGVDINDIRVEVDNTILTVRTSKGISDHISSAYQTTQILKGPYEIVWPLPVNVNPDSVSAEFLDGVLRVIIPRLNQVQVW